MQRVISVDQLFPEHVRPILDELRNAENPLRYLLNDVNLTVKYLSPLYFWVKAGMPFCVADPWDVPLSSCKWAVPQEVCEPH